MKIRRVLKKSVVLATSLCLVASMLTGCGGKDTKKDNAASTAVKEPLKIEVLSKAANFQGEQAGWFGDIVKKKFNLTLNILSPQVSGDSLYKTRAASGNLGDLVVIDNSQLKDCIQSGLVLDISKMIDNYPNLKKYNEQFKYFNANFDKKVNPDGLVYGLPTNMSDTSPTSYSQSIPYSSPILPWNLYTGVGSPKIDNMDGLLTTLKSMQDKYPTTPDGKKFTAITLWKDWDGNTMENARWLSNWYGYESPDETSSVMLNAEGNVQPITNDDGIYRKMLKFFFDANKMGLVDPDSASQDWNTVSAKLTNNQVGLLWYSWETGFYNTIEKGKKKLGTVSVPISDLNIIQKGDPYYGDGSVFAIGAKAKDPKRIMEFLDWYVSPEGMRYLTSGIENFNFTRQADGKLKYTDIGQTAFTDNLKVPAEYGGGGFKDGQNAINTLLLGDISKDPSTGEFYNPNYWNATIESNKTALTNEWTEKYHAKDAEDYYTKNKMIKIVPAINTSLGSDSSDIKTKRSQSKQLVVDTSWKMVFAKNEGEFDKLWTDMKTALDGQGWKDLVTLDTERCNALVKLRAEATANAK